MINEKPIFTFRPILKPSSLRQKTAIGEGNKNTKAKKYFFILD
tara:strand:+ start:115 stop:243 length:129 start_codon:yes stop_codon:yes gene_type:complete